MLVRKKIGALGNFLDAALTSQGYRFFVYVLIAVYALVLILDASRVVYPHETYLAIEERCVWLLIADVVLRGFFVKKKSGWFYFDLVATFMAFVPGLEPTRAIRLFRPIGEILWFKDAAEDTITAVRWALPLLCIMMLTILVLGLIGYYGYASALPEQFGTLRKAIITAFIMVMMEDLSNLYQMAEIALWTTLFYIFLCLAAGVVVLALIFAKSGDASHENDDLSSRNGRRSARDLPRNRKLPKRQPLHRAKLGNGNTKRV